MTEQATAEAVQGQVAIAGHSGGEVAESRRAPPLAQETSLLALISRVASDPRVDMDKFERLLAMQEKLRMAEKREAFDEALARAKANFGPILKRREVDFTSPKGRTHYRHEDLAEIARVVDGPLGEEGVSYRFRSEQMGKGGDADPRRLRVTCIVSRGGYSEETSLDGFEDHSGNKNSHQAVASAATYLQRATLKLALGLAAGVDDDSQSASKAPTPASINDEQAAEIDALIDETDSEATGLLAYVGARSITDMTEAQFAKAKAALLKKKAATKQTGAAA